MDLIIAAANQIHLLAAQLNLPFILSLICITLIIENAWAAQKNQPVSGYSFNIAYTIFYFVFALLIQPLLAYSTTLVIRQFGGGFFTPQFNFRSEYLNQLALGFTYLLIFDFFYYWLHRMQHQLPILWSQHKLHHSDPSVNVSTTYRHHFLEEPLRMIFVLIPLGIVFKISPMTAGIVGMFFSAIGFFVHANIRLHTSYLGYIISGPQLHRIHHSKEREHFDKNLASLFSFYDVLFGTFYYASPDEFPETGLYNGDDVKTLREALKWPFIDWISGRWRNGFNRSQQEWRKNQIFGQITAVVFVICISIAVWKPVDLTPKIKNGELITFTKASAHQDILSFGWAKPGAEETWTSSTEAQINFSTDVKEAKITLSIQPFLLPGIRDSQRLRISQGNAVLYEGLFDSVAPKDISFTVNTNQPIISLTLLIPDAVSLKFLGLTNDDQLIGFGLRSLRISQ